MSRFLSNLQRDRLGKSSDKFQSDLLLLSSEHRPALPFSLGVWQSPGTIESWEMMRSSHRVANHKNGLSSGLKLMILPQEADGPHLTT